MDKSSKSISWPITNVTVLYVTVPWLSFTDVWQVKSIITLIKFPHGGDYHHDLFFWDVNKPASSRPAMFSVHVITERYSGSSRIFTLSYNGFPSVPHTCKFLHSVICTHSFISLVESPYVKADSVSVDRMTAQFVKKSFHENQFLQVTHCNVM